MRIAIVCHSLSGGGSERVSVVLANALTQRGHHISVFTDQRPSREMKLDPAVKLIVLDSGFRIGRFWQLTKNLRRECYDIVYALTPFLTLQSLLAIALAGQQISKIVGSYHGYGYFSVSSGLLNYIGYLLTPIITRAISNSVCVSDSLKTDLIEHWGAKPENLLTIYNPVELYDRATATCETDAGLASATSYILYVGRLSRDKNPMLAIKAFSLLPERFSQLSLVVLGEGPLRKQLEKLALSLGIAARVIFKGYVIDPSNYYEKAKALLLTSHREAFSLVTVEALAHGVPVVSTNSGGPQEILADGHFGFLVSSSDERSLVANIVHALDNPPAKALLQRRAADFSVDRAVNAYEYLFVTVREQAIKQ